MRLDELHVKDYLGVREVHLKFEKPVNLFLGLNGQGKSTIAGAPYFAVTGRTDRGKFLKQDYKRLVREGARSGEIGINTDLGQISRNVRDGKERDETTLNLNGHDPLQVACALSAKNFMDLSPDERRDMLFNLVGAKLDQESVVRRIKRKNVGDEEIAIVQDVFAASDKFEAFKAAEKQAKKHLSMLRAQWETITGETYGSKKAESWTLDLTEDPRDFDIEKAEQEINDLRDQIRALLQERGSIKRQLEICDLGDTDLKTMHSMLEATKATKGLIEKAQRELKELTSPISVFECAHCGKPNSFEGNKLVKVSDSIAIDKQAARKREKELRESMQSWEDDLKLADQYRAKLNMLESLGDPVSPDDIVEIDKKISKIEHEGGVLKEKIELARGIQERKESVDRACKIREKMVRLKKLAELMAPDGIPSEVLSEALDPIHRRFIESARATGWPVVTIRGDMTPLYGGRDYAMLSKSEQYRVRALITEAITHISDIKTVVLDGVDILHDDNRGVLLGWLLGCGYERVLLFATASQSKIIPVENIQTWWINDGNADPVK